MDPPEATATAGERHHNGGRSSESGTAAATETVEASRMPASLLSAQQSPGSFSGCVCGTHSSNRATSYTLGMKFAVSIPSDLFNSVERLRCQERSSRSKLVAVALAEYVARHAGDEVTEAMNRVCEDVDTQPDDFTRNASRRVLERSEW